MCHYKLTSFTSIILNPNLSFKQSRTHQHHRRHCLGHLTQALWVLNCLYLIQQLQVVQVVNRYLVEEHHDNPVTTHFDALNHRTKAQLPYEAISVVVPYHDPVRGETRLGAAADQSHQVTPEKHADQSDSPVVTTKDFAVGVTVVDTEASVKADGKAALILVEGEMVDGRRDSPGRHVRIGGRGGGDGEVVGEQVVEV